MYNILLLPLTFLGSAFCMNQAQLEADCTNCTDGGQLFIKTLWFGHFVSMDAFVCKSTLPEVSRFAIIAGIACQSGIPLPNPSSHFAFNKVRFYLYRRTKRIYYPEDMPCMGETTMAGDVEEFKSPSRWDCPLLDIAVLFAPFLISLILYKGRGIYLMRNSRHNNGSHPTLMQQPSFTSHELGGGGSSCSTV
jgi:hypothetical protein